MTDQEIGNRTILRLMRTAHAQGFDDGVGIAASVFLSFVCAYRRDWWGVILGAALAVGFVVLRCRRSEDWAHALGRPDLDGEER